MCMCMYTYCVRWRVRLCAHAYGGGWLPPPAGYSLRVLRGTRLPDCEYSRARYRRAAGASVRRLGERAPRRRCRESFAHHRSLPRWLPWGSPPGSDRPSRPATESVICDRSLLRQPLPVRRIGRGCAPPPLRVPPCGERGGRGIVRVCACVCVCVCLCVCVCVREGGGGGGWSHVCLCP